MPLIKPHLTTLWALWLLFLMHVDVHSSMNNEQQHATNELPTQQTSFSSSGSLEQQLATAASSSPTPALSNPNPEVSIKRKNKRNVSFKLVHGEVEGKLHGKSAEHFMRFQAPIPQQSSGKTRLISNDREEEVPLQKTHTKLKAKLRDFLKRKTEVDYNGLRHHPPRQGMLQESGTASFAKVRQLQNNAEGMRDSSSGVVIIDAIKKRRSIVFLEISCNGRSIGRVYFEVGRETASGTAVSRFCSSSKTYARKRVRIFVVSAVELEGLRLSVLRGTRLFRIVPNFVIQGGDVTHDDGSGGECIWTKQQGGWHDRFFPDESFDISHDSCGLLSMANEGPNTNQSQFFITCAPCPWLDCRNVVFGRVSKGFDILATIENLGTLSGATPEDVRICDCGVCPPDVEIEEDPFDTTDAALIGNPTPEAETRQDEWAEVGAMYPNKYKQV